MASRQERLAEAAAADEPLDAVLQLGFRTGDELSDLQQPLVLRPVDAASRERARTFSAGSALADVDSALAPDVR